MVYALRREAYKMKKTILSFVVLSFASVHAFADDKMMVAIVNGTSKLWGYAGQTTGVPLKPRYDASSGYLRSPFASTVIVAVGPGSVDRGCRPVPKAENPYFFTGVSLEPLGYPQAETRLVKTEYALHPDRQGWLNYHFSVNGGIGGYVQQVNVSFARPYLPVDCAFEVYYGNLN